MIEQFYKTEEELGDTFIYILKVAKYNIWCEVESLAGIIDIVAEKNNIYYTFHLKKQLSNKVLEQAYRCFIYNTTNYIVIPQKRKREIGFVQREFLKNKNIGILGMYEYEKEYFDSRREWHKNNRDIEDFCNVIYYLDKNKRGKIEKDISLILYDSQRTDKAGIKGGGYDTAFKRSINKIIEYHKSNEYISLQKTWDILRDDFHWSSKHSFFNAISILSYLPLIQEARNLMMDKNK